MAYAKGDIVKAGPELDALIAEKVMGWKKIYFRDIPDAQIPWQAKEIGMGMEWFWNTKEGCFWHEAQICPAYSTDIAAAWEIVAKAHCFSIERGNDARPIQCFLGFINKDEECIQSYHGEADSVPLAICLAALKAVGVET